MTGCYVTVGDHFFCKGGDKIIIWFSWKKKVMNDIVFSERLSWVQENFWGRREKKSEYFSVCRTMFVILATHMCKVWASVSVSQYVSLEGRTTTKKRSTYKIGGLGKPCIERTWMILLGVSSEGKEHLDPEAPFLQKCKFFLFGIFFPQGKNSTGAVTQI